MSDILSPIILSKNSSNILINATKTYLKGYLKNDVFDIYQVKNHTNESYCKNI